MTGKDLKRISDSLTKEDMDKELIVYDESKYASGKAIEKIDKTEDTIVFTYGKTGLRKKK